MSDGDGDGAELDTLSVLFTDLVGSTELRSRLGEDVADVIRRAHDSLIAEVIVGNGGRVVKGLGDGFLATFGSAGRAVAAAVAIQQGFDAQRFVEPHVELPIRIGISLGDVTIEAGDVFGTTVIEASRLCGAANGGQILATGVVATLAKSRGGHSFTDVGTLYLKGLPEPVPAVEVGWERVRAESGIPFPAPLAVREGAFPFIGRDSAVDFMATFAKHAFANSTKACVLIAGEPGMGKTRLGAEFSRRAHDEGATVLFGRCDEDLGISYQPFVEALSHHVTHLGADDGAQLGTHVAELTRLVPDIATRFRELGERAVAGDAEVEQYRLFEAVDSWLQAAASTAGLVLVLDDVHWAAKPTLLLLRHLLRSATAARLLIIATYRDTDLGRTHPLADLLADLRRVPEVERLSLTGLDCDGIEELMAALNGVALDAPGRELAAAVHAETEGNPFFVGELLRHLAETGALVNDGKQWRAATAVAEMSLPEGVREVIGRRLSRLSQTTNDVLAWAAVMGRELRLDVLGRVAGGNGACLDALDEAVDARLVDESGPGRWRFAHALVRSTLLAELRSTRKIYMHLTIGEAYEELAPDDLAALAQHFGEAAPIGAGEKALRYLLATGAVALETLAFDEAAARYGQVLDIIADVGLDAAEAHADAAIGLAIALRWTGRDADDAVGHACDAAAALGDGGRMARVLLETRRPFAARVFESDDLAITRIERCLELLPPDEDRERALLMAALVSERVFVADVRVQIALANDALGIARGLDDPEALVEVLGPTIEVLRAPDLISTDDARAMWAELTEVSERIASPRARARYALLRVGRASGRGDRTMFRAGLDEYDRLAEVMPPAFRWLSLVHRSGYEVRYGDLAVAEGHANELLVRANETGESDAAIWFGGTIGAIQRARGDVDANLERLEPWLAEGGQIATSAAHRIIVALCEAERHDESRALAERFLPLARTIPRDPFFLAWLGPVACAVAELRDKEMAVWLIEQLEPLGAYWSTWGPQSPCAPISTLLARLRATLGDFDAAEAHFAAAIAHCRADQTRLFLADALLFQALARRDRGAPDAEITAPLTEALEIARAGGYGTIERRADRALNG
jgi:class 3 adenylate cyclase/tetratricopeptide (TPR) repeat protein